METALGSKETGGGRMLPVVTGARVISALARGLCLALLFAASATSAAFGQDGSPLFYLTLPADAAGVAQGDARTAAADGPLALAYNPAGLVSAGRSVSLGHIRWVNRTTVTSGVGTLPVGEGTAALFVATAFTLGEPDAPLGTNENTGFPYFNLTAAYARPFVFLDDFALHLGGAAKVLGERVGGEYARGFAFDAGAQLAWRGDAVRAGVAVQHLGQMSEVLGIAATPLPRTVRGGVTITPLHLVDEDGEPFISAAFSVEGSRITSQEQNRLHLGLEVGLFGFAAVRAGLLHGEDLREFSIGAGLSEGGITLDYAVAPLPEGLGPAHFITVAYTWL